MIHVIPKRIDEGIPLIAPRHREVTLDLRTTERFSDGVVKLHYAVAKEPAAAACLPVPAFCQ